MKIHHPMSGIIKKLFLARTYTCMCIGCCIIFYGISVCITLPSVFRHNIVKMLTENPPFTRKSNSPLDNLELVNQLWGYARYAGFITFFLIYYFFKYLYPIFMLFIKSDYVKYFYTEIFLYYVSFTLCFLASVHLILD